MPEWFSNQRFKMSVLIGVAMAGGTAMAASGLGPGLATATAGAVSGTAAALVPYLSGEDRVARALLQRLPRTKPTRIDCGVVAGLCEVQAGSNLFYTDASGRYLVIGRVYDMETRQDLTAARLLAINPDLLVGTGASAAREGSEMPSVATPATVQTRALADKVSLQGLPASGAIVWGKGTASLTIFSDFHCGYCKLLHQELKGMAVRVIERPISLLGTRMLSNAVICASDRREALEQAYQGANLASASCDTSGLAANERFARDHGFDGTPVIVRSDGAVLHGYRPRQVLETWLAGGKVS